MNEWLTSEIVSKPLFILPPWTAWPGCVGKFIIYIFYIYKPKPCAAALKGSRTFFPEPESGDAQRPDPAWVSSAAAGAGFGEGCWSGGRSGRQITALILSCAGLADDERLIKKTRQIVDRSAVGGSELFTSGLTRVATVKFMWAEEDSVKSYTSERTCITQWKL